MNREAFITEKESWFKKQSEALVGAWSQRLVVALIAMSAGWMGSILTQAKDSTANKIREISARPLSDSMAVLRMEFKQSDTTVMRAVLFMQSRTNKALANVFPEFAISMQKNDAEDILNQEKAKRELDMNMRLLDRALKPK